MTDQTLDRDALLAAFADSLEQSGDNYALLRQWREAHPNHAEDLTQFVLDKLAFGDEDEKESSEAVGETLAAGRRALAQLRPKPALATLYDPAAGRTAATLARMLRLSPVFVASLELRMIDAADIPKSLAARLAQSVGRTTEDMVAFLRAAPRLSPAAQYKSKTSPQVGAAQSFTDALQTVSAQDRAFWEAEAARDGVLGDD